MKVYKSQLYLMLVHLCSKQKKSYFFSPIYVPVLVKDMFDSILSFDTFLSDFFHNQLWRNLQKTWIRGGGYAYPQNVDKNTCFLPLPNQSHILDVKVFKSQLYLMLVHLCTEKKKVDNFFSPIICSCFGKRNV